MKFWCRGLALLRFINNVIKGLCQIRKIVSPKMSPRVSPKMSLKMSPKVSVSLSVKMSVKCHLGVR